MKIILAFLLITFSTEIFSKDLRKISYDGPNCLNTVLLYKGFNQSYHYTSLAEFQIVLTSPLCQQVSFHSLEENLVGIVQSESKFANPNFISHGFIKIKDQSVFEKKGYSSEEPIRLVDLSTVIKDYEIQNPEQSIKLFRCQQFDLWKRQANLSLEILNYLSKLEEIERKLNSNSEVSLIDFIENVKNYQIQSQDEILALKLMAAKIVSLANQLSIWKKNNLYSKTKLYEYDPEHVLKIFE